MLNNIELEKGQLTWIPKTVIYKGEEYPAPLNLLPFLVRDVMIEFLIERKQERK